MILRVCKTDSFNRFLEDAIRVSNPSMIALVIIRFYFVWRGNAAVTSGVRTWLATLEDPHPHLQTILCEVTQSVKNCEPELDMANWAMNPKETIEDHIVFPQDICNATVGTSVYYDMLYADLPAYRTTFFSVLQRLYVGDYYVY
jgi:hypothetical protein